MPTHRKATQQPWVIDGYKVHLEDRGLSGRTVATYQPIVTRLCRENDPCFDRVESSIGVLPGNFDHQSQSAVLEIGAGDVPPCPQEVEKSVSYLGLQSGTGLPSL